MEKLLRELTHEVKVAKAKFVGSGGAKKDFDPMPITEREIVAIQSEVELVLDDRPDLSC